MVNHFARFPLKPPWVYHPLGSLAHQVRGHLAAGPEGRVAPEGGAAGAAPGPEVRQERQEGSDPSRIFPSRADLFGATSVDAGVELL